MTQTPRDEQAIRLLQRYLVEVVERYDLCPWARGARTKGHVAIGVLWGQPELATWIACAGELLGRRDAQVAMVIAPELTVDRNALHTIRNHVSLAIPTAGVAEFHPDAPLDLATPARLVPYARRSPDPMLQLVPLAVLDAVRGSSPGATRLRQAQMLSGDAPPPRRDTADRIADANHATIARAVEEIEATLADIAADRAASYTALGITYGGQNVAVSASESM